MADKFKVLDATATVPAGILAASAASGGQIVLVARPREGRLLLAFAQGDTNQGLVWTNCVDLGLGGAAGADLPLAAWNVAMEQLVAAIGQERARVDEVAKGGALRGEWKGALAVEDGKVKVGLVRAAAPYCGVKVESAESAWEVTVTRTARFFAGAQTQRRSFPKLAAACEWGMQAAAELVSAACGVRDTHRRNHIDPGYAEKHPVKVKQAPKRDPIGPDLKALAKRIPTLASVATPEAPSCPSSLKKAAKATAKGAENLVVSSEAAWAQSERLELLGRSATLIAEANALVTSDLCLAGRLKTSAFAAIKRAGAAYEKARKAAVTGKDIDLVYSLRKIAEDVAEAAKAAAEACTAPRPEPTKKRVFAKGPDKPKTAAKPKAEPKPRTAKPSTGGKSQAEKDALLSTLFTDAIARAAAELHAQGTL